MLIDWNPLGVVPSPFYGKLVFVLLRKEGASSNKTVRLQKAYLFPNNFRITDDLCPFSNDEFKNYYNDIYFDELKLKKGNEDHCKASFLDLSIVVRDRTFTTMLFDKRNPFYISHLPYLDSNAPTKICNY